MSFINIMHEFYFYPSRSLTVDLFRRQASSQQCQRSRGIWRCRNGLPTALEHHSTASAAETSLPQPPLSFVHTAVSAVGKVCYRYVAGSNCQLPLQEKYVETTQPVPLLCVWWKPARQLCLPLALHPTGRCWEGTLCRVMSREHLPPLFRNRSK